MSVMSSLVDIFASPSKAFEGKKEKGQAWIPLVLTMVLSMVSFWLYFDKVDYDWYIDYTVSQGAEEMSPAELEQAKDMMQSVPKSATIGVLMLGIVLGVPIAYALFSVYLIIVSNIRNDELTFGQCFTLVAWSSLVMIISTLVGIVSILLNENGQMPLEIMRGLSFQNLLSLSDPTDPWYKITSNIDLTSIWNIVLLAIGYQKFTNSSTTASYIIALIPTILVVGITAALVL